MNAERRAQLLGFLAELGLKQPPTEAALAWLDEALSHTSAGLARNHERLEFLGDAVLRLAASEFLQQQRPGLSVGQSSALRAQLVSDRWLAELGERCGIDGVLRIGSMAAGDDAGRATLRAEACEAVIGALYRIWGNLDPVLQWLTPHWQQSLAELAADPHRHNWKSALQEWSQGKAWGCRATTARSAARCMPTPSASTAGCGSAVGSWGKAGGAPGAWRNRNRRGRRWMG